MSLAKEMKIRTIKTQRETVIHRLENAVQNEEKGGFVQAIYEGTLYPEVKAYLVKEGFEVREVKAKDEFLGCVTIITIAKVLSTDLEEEDLEEAECYEYGVKVKNGNNIEKPDSEKTSEELMDECQKIFVGLNKTIKEARNEIFQK